MSYKQKIVSVVASAFAVVSFSAFASAQDTTTNQPDSAQKQERREHRRGGENRMGKERRGGRHGGGKMGMREFAQLNLTDAQKQQIHEIMQANHKTGNQADFQEMRQLAQAKRDGVITAEQTERLKSIKQQMRQNMEQTHQQTMAILTPEQKTQLEQLREKRRQEMKEHRQTRRDKKDDTDDDDN